MQAKDIMVEPIRIDKSDTLSHAMELMEKYDTRRLLVTHNGELSGIITMRNIARKLGTWKKSNLPASSLHVATATTNSYTKVLPDMDFKDVITLMDKEDGILIVSRNKDILGWITPSEILKHAKAVEGYAAEAMREPITACPGDRVTHVRRLMLDKDIGRIPVIEDHAVVGIVTEKDIAKAMQAFRDLVSDNQQEGRIRNLIVGDIMTRKVKSVLTNTPISEVIDLMLRDNIGGVPVLNLREELVGIISRRSIIAILARKG